MRFMVMHKVDAKMEAGEKPAGTIVERMGKYVGESIQKGVFVDGAGLHGSRQRVRMVFEGGKRVSVEKGPFEGRNELLASFAMIQAWSIDEAVEMATKIGQACGGDVELEVGLVVEPWDIGLAPKPEDELPKRYLVLRKADAAFERGEDKAALGGAYEELAEKMFGAVISVATLKPSKRGARLDRARRWTDGPFAESKELVAGFSIIEVATLEDAKRWAEAYGDILVDNEVDVREVVA